jgi:hypothetical protein
VFPFSRVAVWGSALSHLHLKRRGGGRTPVPHLDPTVSNGTRTRHLILGFVTVHDASFGESTSHRAQPQRCHGSVSVSGAALETPVRFGFAHGYAVDALRTPFEPRLHPLSVGRLSRPTAISSFGHDRFGLDPSKLISHSRFHWFICINWSAPSQNRHERPVLRGLWPAVCARRSPHETRGCRRNS